METDFIDKIKVGSVIYPLRDTTSGYVTKDVDDLTNYTPTAEMDEALDGKANTEDVPAEGSIAEGNTGYVTGGDVYDALAVIESRLGEL